MNGQYCWRLIVTHKRKCKRDHKLGQYSEVQKIACVYLNIKPNQLSKVALHRKMMQYGIQLSKKHPSETNNSFFLSKINHFLAKNETFYNKIFCYQNNIGLKYFADIRFCMFKSNLIDKNILRNKNSERYSK